MNPSAANSTRKSVGSGPVREGLDEILRSSCRLMAQRGFHGTSMRDLAEATGRSLAGLYHYFASKEDLLFLINLHGFRTLNDAWVTLSRSFAVPREQLYAFVFFHMSYFSEHTDEMRVMTWGTQSLSLENARVIQRLKDRYRDATCEVVGHAYRDATGETLDPARLTRETYLLFGMMNWTFGWYDPRVHGSLAELIADIYQTFTRGLIGPEPAALDLSRMHAVTSVLFDHSKSKSMWSPLPSRVGDASEATPAPASPDAHPDSWEKP